MIKQPLISLQVIITKTTFLRASGKLYPHIQLFVYSLVTQLSDYIKIRDK